MLIVTTNEIPGFRVLAVQGEVMGLTVRSRDEVGQLARTFNVMIDVLRQRERERDASPSTLIGEPTVSMHDSVFPATTPANTPTSMRTIAPTAAQSSTPANNKPVDGGPRA